MEDDGVYPDFNAAKAELFEAISHPARIKILQALDERSMGFAELARTVGLGSGGHLSFHLTKLGHLVRMTPEGTYTLTGDGKEALWSVNSLRQATDAIEAKARGTSLKHRSLTKPILGAILVAVIILGGFGAYQQAQFASELQQIVTQQKVIGILEGGVPFTNGESASLVIGQKNFDSYGPATSQSGLSLPSQALFDSSGNLWVVDTFNSRVLEFRPPFNTGMNASLVLGQENFASVGHLTTRNLTVSPSAAAFDSSGNLWVADSGNNRVVEFRPPFKTGMDESLVIGQRDFLYHFAGAGLPQRGSLSGPTNLAFDSLGALWLLDSVNDRVLEFRPPFSDGMNASLVLGQHDFQSKQTSKALNGLNASLGDLAVDPSNDVWVGDAGNNRILEFKPPFRNGMNASLVVGQENLVTETQASVSPWRWTNFGWGIAFDRSGNLWATSNGRLLAFKPPFIEGVRAFPSVEIGQPNFTSASWRGGQRSFSSLNGQSGAYYANAVIFHPGFDLSGNLWVPDGGNRILEFLAVSSAANATTPSPASNSMIELFFLAGGVSVLIVGTGFVLMRRGRSHPRRHSTDE